MNLKRIENIEVKSRRVFVRVDLNLPLENGKIKDSIRILKFLPTLEVLSRKGAKIIIGTHFGSSENSSSIPSAKPIFEILQNHFKQVTFAETTDLSLLESTSKTIPDGEALFLENLNSYPGELENSPEFSEKFSKIADIYVDDAFSIAHKPLASNVGITNYLPSFAGPLFFREYESLSNLIQRPDKPFVAIIGGSKVSSKIKILNSLLNRVTSILIGGGMAYTFLKSRAVPVGSSLIEKEFEVLSHQFIDKAGIAGVDFQMPIDHVIADSFGDKAKIKNVDRMGITDGWLGMDIGSKTISSYEKIIKSAGTIFWTGSMGVVELEKFSNGSLAIAKAIAKSNAKSIIGGDSTISSIFKAGVDSKITHLSIGGSATLEFLEGKSLPGIKALDKENE